MDSPVTGANTPPRLAKLRRAIYAIIGDSLLFSEAEQLQLSLSAHECQDAAALRRELARLQGETDRRLRVLALQHQATAQAQVYGELATQRTDLLTLVKYPGLDRQTGDSLTHLLTCHNGARRFDVLGTLYLLVLERRGFFAGVQN